MVSVKTIGRKNDFVENCFAGSTTYFSVIFSISFFTFFEFEFFENQLDTLKKNFLNASFQFFEKLKVFAPVWKKNVFIKIIQDHSR